MDCARINAAHDSPEAWEKMAANIRKARNETGKSCMICVDIPGPKLRTGRFRPGPQVLKIRPDKDVFGRVVRPSLIWLTDIDQPVLPPQRCAARLLLSGDFISRLEVGSKLAFSDARGARRRFKVTNIDSEGVWLELRKTAYLTPETRLKISGHKRKDAPETLVGPLPPVEQFAVLRIGDTLVLTRSEVPGTPEGSNPDGSVRPAKVPCTLPKIFDDVRVGEHVWFDDGKIGGVIESVENDEIEIKINHAKPGGSKLKGDRGINLPETQLTLPSLTDTDRDVLASAKDHADLIGYSFVRSAADVSELQQQLKDLGAESTGLILKIETRNAFDNLPDLLLESLKSQNTTGVMIARGDLAIEAGFERMAEVQEEILWMCEAAHLPVIWATQVLEQLSKKGICSRAEITDAAMSERAECVMLNKGPYVVEAVRTLDDILTRMQSHLHKKNPLMRPLKLAERFFNNR
jgi:pyruvate kinase